MIVIHAAFYSSSLMFKMVCPSAGCFNQNDLCFVSSRLLPDAHHAFCKPRCKWFKTFNLSQIAPRCVYMEDSVTALSVTQAPSTHRWSSVESGFLKEQSKNRECNRGLYHAAGRHLCRVPCIHLKLWILIHKKGANKIQPDYFTNKSLENND